MRDVNRYFIKEENQMANRHIKSHSISSIFREMQIKTSILCYFISTRLKKFKSTVLRADNVATGVLTHTNGNKIGSPPWKTI